MGFLDALEFPAQAVAQPHPGRWPVACREGAAEAREAASLPGNLHRETTAPVSPLLLGCQVAVKESSGARN